MRGFRGLKGITERRATKSIVFSCFLSAALLVSGCSGLVSGNSTGGGGGTPTSLTISNAVTANATSTSVGVDWQTSAPATSQVEYGTTTSYGSTTAVNSTMVTSHQVTVSNLKSGTTYHCRVHSTDANSNTAVSGDLACATSASADTTPPTVSITSPAANATLSATVNLTANATDNVAVASVQFKVDNANAGPALTSAPYTYALNTNTLTNANHTLTAVATDTSGNTATSAAITVKVSNTTTDTTPPVVTMTAPASGAVVSKTVTVSANATDNVAVAKVQFQLDGANVGTAVTVAPYAYSWDTTKTTNAAHTLRAIATDTSNNSTTSASVSVTVNNSATDTTPPTVAITSPASGASVSGTVTVSGTASDNVAVSLVQVSVDNGSFSNASGTTSWSFSLNTVSLSNASHTLAAKATDSSGNTTTSSPVSITVSNSGGTGTTVTVNSTTVFQTIDGFGASSAYTGDGITNSQADLFWTTTSGVGLSLLRVQIQPDGTYPDLATMQKAQARGIKIWGTPWTPPASMKTNGSTTNGGSLIASDYQAYADYLTNYILTLKNSYGINLYALSIQNEPNYVATWESCIWTGQQFHDFLLNNLLPDFAKNGVVTKIIMPEETGWFFDLATTTLNDPATAAGVSIIAAHDYNNGAAAPYALGQNQGKGLWETEISTFGTFDPSMSDALVWGQEIHDWMTIANANAWHYWWLIGDSAGDNQGLVSQSGQVSKRLYMMGNFSKFARPGYVRIGATSSPVSGVSISAYKDPNSGTFAIVAINHNGSSVPLNFTFSGLTPTSVTPWITSATLSLAQQSSISVGGGSFSFTLPASSVTTFAGN